MCCIDINSYFCIFNEFFTRNITAHRPKKKKIAFPAPFRLLPTILPHNEHQIEFESWEKLLRCCLFSAFNAINGKFRIFTHAMTLLPCSFGACCLLIMMWIKSVEKFSAYTHDRMCWLHCAHFFFFLPRCKMWKICDLFTFWMRSLLFSSLVCTFHNLFCMKNFICTHILSPRPADRYDERWGWCSQFTTRLAIKKMFNSFFQLVLFFWIICRDIYFHHCMRIV